MDQRKTIILDNSNFFYQQILKHFPELSIELIESENQNKLFDIIEDVILFINTSFINDTFKYEYERGGLEFIKTNFHKFGENYQIVFFSYENEENIKFYLKNKWLKYDKNYFLHYPFDTEKIKKIFLDKTKLKITDNFKKEKFSELIKSLRSFKHDLLNKISQLIPDLNASINNYLNNPKNNKLELFFDPATLKNNVLDKINSLNTIIENNKTIIDAETRQNLNDLKILLDNLYELIEHFKNNKKIDDKLINDKNTLTDTVNNIKTKLENIIGILNYELKQ
ncbi:MAG TPA: hypothetical protein VIR55_08285 [Ignavibacteria bacterium]